MKRFLSIFLSLLYTLCVYAQPNPHTLWSRVYGGETGDAGATSIVQLTDGGFAVAGYRSYTEFNDYSTWILRLDANGDSMLAYSDSSERLPPGMYLCTSGSGYVVAYTVLEYIDPGGNVYSRLGLRRFYASGESQWVHSLHADGYGDSAKAVIQTPNGLYAIAGSRTSYDPENTDGYFALTPSDSITNWPLAAGTFGGNGYDVLRAIAPTMDGGFVLAGITSSFGMGMTDYYVVRVDSAGDTLWTRTYGADYADNAHAIIATATGSYVIAGYTASFGASGYDVYLVKIDDFGDTLWTGLYGGLRNQKIYTITETPNGDYVFVGSQDIIGTPCDSTLLMRVSSEGQLLWTMFYQGCTALSLDRTNDGGYVLAGHIHDLEFTELLVTKTGPDQTVASDDPFILPPFDLPQSLQPFHNHLLHASQSRCCETPDL